MDNVNSVSSLVQHLSFTLINTVSSTCACRVLRREPHCDLNCDNGLWAPGVRPTMCIEIFRAAYHLRGKLNTLFFHKLQFVLVCSKLSEFFTSCHHYFCTYRRNWARHLPNRNQGLRPERDGTRATGSHLPDCASVHSRFMRKLFHFLTHTQK